MKYTEKGWLKFQYVNLNRTASEIAKECEVATSIIYRQLRDFNLLQQRKEVKDLKEHKTYRNKEWLTNQLITQNKNVKQVSKEFNISVATIDKYIKFFNLPVKGRKGGIWTDKAWLEHQYSDFKKSAKEISESVHTDKGTIYLWLRRHGIPSNEVIRKRQITENYANEKWLRHQYIVLRKSTIQIAKETNSNHRTISVWLKKFNIKTRQGAEQKLTGKEKYIDEKWLKEQYQVLRKPINEIAKECDIKEGTIRVWLGKYKIHRDKPVRIIQKNNTYMNEEWLYTKHWQEGKTLKQMGKECGSNPVTIQHWMIKYNIPRRKPSDYQRPSGLEQLFMQFIETNQLPFKFVGTDASEKLDVSQNQEIPWKKIYPDFKHETEKMVIEIGDKRHKERMGKKIHNWKEWEKKRIESYNSIGWKALIVWEDEFSNNPDKILVDIKKMLV